MDDDDGRYWWMMATINEVEFIDINGFKSWGDIKDNKRKILYCWSVIYKMA